MHECQNKWCAFLPDQHRLIVIGVDCIPGTGLTFLKALNLLELVTLFCGMTADTPGEVEYSVCPFASFKCKEFALVDVL